MQGRLSPLVNGKIQAFPWDIWREEFSTAQEHDFHLMEWTLDQERLYENPLMTRTGRNEIRLLMTDHNVRIASLTGDCFMQAPFYKATGPAKKNLLDDLKNIIDACAEVGIQFIVMPLVDNGRLDTPDLEKSLKADLERLHATLKQASMKIIFESDYPPEKLRTFIDGFPKNIFGINYDIGNSASLGFDPTQEISAYGEWIDNVHVKDRQYGGTTVPLGTGNADFPTVFRLLAEASYDGNYILQTARAADNDHAGALCRYREMTMNWIQCAQNES